MDEPADTTRKVGNHLNSLCWWVGTELAMIGSLLALVGVWSPRDGLPGIGLALMGLGYCFTFMSYGKS